MSSKFLAELSNDYEKLFKTELGYDVIIYYAGEEPNVKEIHAHSNILSIRSQYFRTTLSKWKIYFKKTKYFAIIIYGNYLFYMNINIYYTNLI